MRTFFRFFWKSREGIPSYMVYIGTMLGSIFAIHMFTLFCVLVKENYHDYIGLLFYDVLGTMIAAFGFCLWSDQLLHFSTAGGVSRRTFLKGMAVCTPAAALLTALAMQIIYMITDGIYIATGNRLGNFATAVTDIYNHNDFPPTLSFRLVVSNISLIFCAVIVAYTIALIYVGVRRRFNIPAAFVSAGALAYFYYFMFYEPFNYVTTNGYYSAASFCDWIMHNIGAWTDPAYQLKMSQYVHISGVAEQDTFWSSLAAVVSLALICFYAVYFIYSLLIRKTPVRGKEEEGAI